MAITFNMIFRKNKEEPLKQANIKTDRLSEKSKRLNFHTENSRADKADELWQRHYGELLRPIPAGMPYAGWTSTVLTPLGVKEDVVIPGVGWMSLSGTCGQIRVTHPQTLEIKHRKAMI